MPVPNSTLIRRAPRAAIRAVGGTLDAGVEPAYAHRQPLIRGSMYGSLRETRPGDVLRKLGRDFDVRYVWADLVTIPSLRQVFPDPQTLLANSFYLVLELPPISRGVCDR